PRRGVRGALHLLEQGVEALQPRLKVSRVEWVRHRRLPLNAEHRPGSQTPVRPGSQTPVWEPLSAKLCFDRRQTETGVSEAAFPNRSWGTRNQPQAAHNHYPCAPNMGTCLTSSTLPLPRYMCTPHGRHGSKLRTARMMSMPLNLSGPFSSNSGVFCTASS